MINAFDYMDLTQFVGTAGFVRHIGLYTIDITVTKNIKSDSK